MYDIRAMKYFCLSKLNMTFRECGRITIKEYYKYHRAYEDLFDTELILQASHTTYAKLHNRDEEIGAWDVFD